MDARSVVVFRLGDGATLLERDGRSWLLFELDPRNGEPRPELHVAFPDRRGH